MVISIALTCWNQGRQSIQDQSSVLGADILNNPRNYFGRSSNYPQRIQFSPKHQSGEFRCSWDVNLCNIDLKKSNAASFYTPIVSKLLITVQMWKQHEEGNLITMILTPHLSKLIKFWSFYGTSKLSSTHFHCCSKLFWPYWLTWY